MRKARSSIIQISLALLVAGCGSGTGNGGGDATGGSVSSGGNASNGGSTGSQSGGAAGNDSGGASGNPSGGTTGNPGGGTTGTANGGTTGATNGGTTGNPSGGAGGKSTGGSAGSAAGGSAGTPNGGTTSNPNGGSGGKVTGTGGAAGAGDGGSAAGGVQGTGGSSAVGSGGSSTPTTALITSASGSFWKTGTWTESTSNATVTVNDATTAQTWEGFGGAFNEKGWSYLTTKAMQDEAMQLLFGADGAHFAWGRIPIGASDYAMDRYSLDETANDTTMASFSIDRDKQKLIPYIKAAQAVKSDIRFWASPWTPPTWMKTGPYNPNTGKSNSNFDGGVMKSDDATLGAFAQYLVKFVKAYGEQGINVEIVSPQNEPNYQQNYPSCHWDTATYVKFVGSFLGPALISANLTTRVMDGTLSNPSGDADIGASVLKDSTAKGFCKAIGVQWGMADASQVNTLKNLAGGMSIWLSETKCGGTTGSTAPAPNDLSYGKDTWGYIRDAIKNGLTAYNAWNMVLDKGGLGIDDTRKWPQNALLVADSGSITQTPAYYVFRHFSQFVDPGAKVVSTSGGDAVAFKNPDGSLVAVMYNSGSANSNYVVSIGGKKLQFAMPASGWATVKYK
jgi:glucosylceramidase